MKRSVAMRAGRSWIASANYIGGPYPQREDREAFLVRPVHVINRSDVWSTKMARAVMAGVVSVSRRPRIVKPFWDAIRVTVMGRHLFDAPNGWTPGRGDELVVVTHRPLPEERSGSPTTWPHPSTPPGRSRRASRSPGISPAMVSSA